MDVFELVCRVQLVVTMHKYCLMLFVINCVASIAVKIDLCETFGKLH